MERPWPEVTRSRAHVTFIVTRVDITMFVTYYCFVLTIVMSRTLADQNVVGSLQTGVNIECLYCIENT